MDYIHHMVEFTDETKGRVRARCRVGCGELTYEAPPAVLRGRNTEDLFAKAMLDEAAPREPGRKVLHL